MKRILVFCCFFILSSCSAEEARQKSMKEALAQSSDCHSLPTHGMRARCVGARMLQADKRNGINPKYDMQKISNMLQIEDSVDSGQISEQEAAQRMELAFSAIDAQAKSDDADRARGAWGNALMGMSSGMQNASLAFKPAYHAPTNCTTMPLGAGQYTTHCY